VNLSIKCISHDMNQWVQICSSVCSSQKCLYQTKRRNHVSVD